MATKRYKPTSPALRERIVLQNVEITTDKPEKSLVKGVKRKVGRSQGRITVRHRGGGVKRKYRQVDFKRRKDGVPAKVASIEYDPNRSANIALVVYKDGEKQYIVAPAGIKVGDLIVSGPETDIRVGNALQIKNIPNGSIIHNVELRPNGGAQLARSAGASVTLMAKGEKYATIKLPSGETRWVSLECKAVMGQVGNSEKRNTKVGKAGITRKKGFRPTVRGAVMNPVDHPHGGGEGRAPVGKSSPRTKWGKIALGKKTRKKPHRTDWAITKRRK